MKIGAFKHTEQGFDGSRWWRLAQEPGTLSRRGRTGQEKTDRECRDDN